MTVYVDNMLRTATVGHAHSRWSHLLADTHEELIVFADRLGLKHEWIQSAGTYREHFDLTEGVRRRAIAAGAEEITYPSGTGLVLARKRRASIGERAAARLERAAQIRGEQR